MSQEGKFYCCKIDCPKDAVFNIQEIGEGKTYENYYHSCNDHLSEFIFDDVLCEVYKF